MTVGKISRIPQSKIALGRKPNIAGTMQNFVLRHKGKTHYRVYVFIHGEGLLQVLVFYTEGTNVFGKYLHEFNTMLENCEVALSAIARQATSTPVKDLVLFYYQIDRYLLSQYFPNTIQFEGS